MKIKKKLGEDRIMDFLKRFFFKQENLNSQKRLGEDCLIFYQTNIKSK